MQQSPPIAEKHSSALRTIGEVAAQLDVQQHVLRFWESKFCQIVPEKHRGRRYYRPEDIVVLCQIKKLLYEDKYTIKGVQSFLDSALITKKKTVTQSAFAFKNTNVTDKKILQQILTTLQESRDNLKAILEDTIPSNGA